MPLDRQDTRLWDQDLILEAEALLRRVGGAGRFGRFQCMAATQAVHAARRETGRTDHGALDLLYEALTTLSPTVGMRVAHAAAPGRGARAGRRTCPARGVGRTRRRDLPFWAVRASLLARGGACDAARVAYGRAIALAPDAAVRDHLTCERDRVG